VRGYLAPLLFFQRFFLPALLAILGWAIWRTVRRKDLATGLALYLGVVIIVDGFMNTGVYLPGLEKGSIRYSELCAAFLLTIRPPAAVQQASRRFLLVLAAAYFALLFVSAVRSNSVVAGIFEFRAIIFPQIVALLIAMRGFPTPADYRRFVLLLTGLVLLIAVVNFWDIFFDTWLLHSDSLFTAMYWMNRKQGRFGSVFLNPNMLGAFMVLVFPSMFIWALNEPMRWRRLYAWVGLLALAFSVVETQSRGPMLAFAIALPLLAIGPCGAVSRTRRFAFLGVLLIIFTVFMPGFYDHAIERFGEIDKEMSTEEGRTRETVWLYARQMIADHPVMGIGFGEKQFVAAMDQLGFRDKYAEEPLDNPHNSYLQMTVYAGIPALAAFVLANLLLLWGAGVASWRDAAGGTTQIVFGLAVGIAGFLAVIYPDMHMFTQTVAPVYWVFFGLLLSTTAVSVPVRVEKRYEDSGSDVRNARQHLAGQSPAGSPRYRWDDPRATAARADRAREGRAATPDDAPLWSDAHGQQARVQLASVAGPVGVRRDDDRGEFFPSQRADRLLASGADARDRKR
jgi:O-antigen ligase